MRYGKASRDTIAEIGKFVRHLQKAGVNMIDVFFAEVKTFKATSQEHKEARYPGLSKYQQNFLFNQDRRYFNIQRKDTKIISTPIEWVEERGIGGGVIHKRKWFLSVAAGKKALEAKDHQDKINVGGARKSEDLQLIATDPTILKEQNQRLKEILRRAGIQ